MIIISGSIKKYIFYNDKSGYAVILLDNGIVAFGDIPRFLNGESVELNGDWREHPEYGKQFSFAGYKVVKSDASHDLLKLLSSGIIKGIKEKLALKIIENFGENTLDVIENKIEKLAEIRGIGKKKAIEIRNALRDDKAHIELSIFLYKHGIPFIYARRIEKIFGGDSLTIIRENPYRLINDIWGIGFRQADMIASNLGVSGKNHLRIKSGILYILEEASKRGHVFITIADLISECTVLFEFEPSSNEALFQELESDNQIVIAGDKIYLYQLYFFERGIEENIKRLNRVAGKNIKMSQKEISQFFKGYSNEQIDAVKNSLNQKILIITGGPGTGKTETLRGIINVYESRGLKILMAAPTGRAAKRMTEIISRDAKTIHRLLEYNPVLKNFNRNGEYRLDADLLIIDEVSMVDVSLMYNLLEAVDDNTNLILVGDSNQLPSVGPGNILKDLIESDIVAVSTLTKIYRQAEKSDIISVAYRILKGDVSFIAEDFKNDFLFLEENEEELIPGKILKLCSEILPEEKGFDPISDIQVLAPVHKGVNGTVNLNKILQQGLNKSEEILKHKNFNYRTGDKVMQLINNYEKDIFNGDWGFIMPGSKNKSFYLRLNNRIISYSEEEFDDLTLAYSITVHKSQGSEYPCVIMPIVKTYGIMLQRNLLYTAVTRAKKMMIIIGSKKALASAVNSNRILNRNTTLFKDFSVTRRYVPLEE